jgi:hypothetical protein
MWSMKFIATLIVLLSICAGCQTMRGKLHTVNLSHGISKSDAMIIAECYSAKHLGGGKIEGIQDGGDHWIAVGRLGGYVAKPLSFDIDKRSGKVTSTVGPNYDNPLDIYP